MANILDRDNQHLLLKKTDNTNNSFIANINKLAAKLDIVIEAVGLFDENAIPVLEEIAELDLDAAIKDLEKGSYLGNRKIDINLLYNMTGINADTDEAIAIDAWTDPTKTVMYSGATALFKDGTSIYIPFMFDENPVNISTHADLLLQLNTNQEFLEKLDNTLIASFAHPVVGEILRIYDVDGVASNLDRLTLHAKTGSFKEANTDYYWTKSTSALQTLTMRVGDIGMIGNNIESFIALANNVIQLVDLQERIPELVDTYTDGVPNKDATLYNNLTKLVALHTNLDALQILHTNINKIISVEDNINVIQEVSDNIVPNLTTILSSYAHAVEAKNAANTAKEYSNSASTSAATALAKANEIKKVTVGSTTTAVAGSNASVVYDTDSGKFHFIIPQGIKGDKGDAFTINARGTTEQRSLYDNEVAGFSFFDLNTSQLYLKLTNDSGNWSDGVQFGKGDPGEDGAAGVGISSITFTSTTDSSGNPGQPDAVDTYSINYTDGSTTTFTVANGNSFNLSDSTSKVYVSKQGSDFNNGLSIENPKATITNAITAANALLADTPRAVVEIMDASRYQEDITIPQNIVVRGNDATLEGTVILNNDSYFDVYAHYARVPDSVMVSKVGNSHSYYKAVVQDAGGTLGSLTGCTNLSSNAAGGTLFAQIELQKVTHVGIKEETTTGVGHIHVYIKGMYLTADDAIGIYGVGTASDIVGIVEHILMSGSLSNTRGIVFDSANGSLNISSNKIAATTAYDVTSGKVKLSCPDITGITSGNASVVLTTDNLSDSLDLDSSTTPASSKAVSKVNTKADNAMAQAVANAVPLSSSLDNDSNVVAATSRAVKTLKDLLDNSLIPVVNATPFPDPNTIMCRDTAGRVRVEDPVHDKDVVNKVYVDSVINIGSNGAYGLKWNQEIDVYQKLGATNRTQIQKNMKRCVLNSDGTVNYYLDPFNSTLKADGTTAILTGADGNIMVEVPKFWYKHELNGNEHQWWVSPTSLTGYNVHPWFLEGGVEHDFRYYRAYTCINQGGVLRSVSGVTPTRNQTRNTFRTQARANGAGWNLCSWNAINAIQLLYLTEYCSFNSQAMIGHGNHTGQDYGIVTGQSNVIGNASSASLNNDMWMSYRGIENFYADCWEFVDGINVQNYKVFLNQNPDTFADDVFTGDYEDSGVTVPAGADQSYVKKISGNFLPTVLGGSSSTYVTDGFWSNTGNRIVLFGGDANNGALIGAFCLNVDNAASLAYVTVGAGLSR